MNCWFNMESRSIVIATVSRLSSGSIKRLAPDLYPAITALGAVGENSTLEPELLELVFLRASQLNGCAYCVQYHISNLQKLDVPQYKLNLVVAWEESGLFSEREKAALAWTEEITLLAKTHASDAAYAAVTTAFSEEEVVRLTAAIATINVWNRFGATFRFPPEFD